MKLDHKQAFKVFSQTLTALNSLRSLWRSTSGIRKLLTSETKSTVAQDPKQSEVKANQLKGALVSMGFSKGEADRAVKKLSGKLHSEELPDLLRAALTELHKG